MQVALYAMDNADIVNLLTKPQKPAWQQGLENLQTSMNNQFLKMQESLSKLDKRLTGQEEAIGNLHEWISSLEVEQHAAHDKINKLDEVLNQKVDDGVFKTVVEKTLMAQVEQVTNSTELFKALGSRIDLMAPLVDRLCESAPNLVTIAALNTVLDKKVDKTQFDKHSHDYDRLNVHNLTTVTERTTGPRN